MPNETTNDSLIDRIAWGDVFAAWEAAERYRKNPRAEDLPKLVDAYERRRLEPKLKDVALRMEIVDLVSLIGTSHATEFLKKVARSRTSYQVRYDAMRGLIELGVQNWRSGSDSPKMLRSNFYASLLAYERYRRGEIDFEVLRALAHSKTNGRGDHWEWITHLEPRFSAVE